MSSVIKAGQTGHYMNKISAVQLTDHLVEARQALEVARRQAEQTLAQARQEKEKVLAEAQQEGHKTGYEEGCKTGKENGYQEAHEKTVEQFQKENANLVSNMERLIVEVEADRENLRITAERNLLEFAVSLASKLTFAIGKEHRESAIENMKRAIQMIGTKTDLTVRVHPDDVASMEKYSLSLVTKMGESIVFNMIADETISPGGCVVANEQTDVDARLESQVDELVTLLLGEKADNG